MAIQQVYKFLQQVENLTSGIGDWVSSGTPNTAIGAAVQGRMRSQCDAWSNGGQWATALSATNRYIMSNICNPWLESQGSGDPDFGVPTKVDYYSGKDLSPYGGARIDFRQGTSGVWTTKYVLSYTVRTNDPQFEPGVTTLRVVKCDGSTELSGILANQTEGNPQPFDWTGTLAITQDNACFSTGVPIPTPPPGPLPNPNPRPDPGLDPETELPYEDPSGGGPRWPMPDVEDPFEVTINLPDLVIEGTEGASGGYSPAGPVSPGDEITGVGDPEGENAEEEFPDPPEGEIWVGFTVELVGQSRVSAGFVPSSLPDEVYASPVGGVYAILDFGDGPVIGPYQQIRNVKTTWISPLPGLPLTGARVHTKFSGVSYKIVPLSQPLEAE